MHRLRPNRWTQVASFPMHRVHQSLCRVWSVKSTKMNKGAYPRKCRPRRNRGGALALDRRLGCLAHASVVLPVRGPQTDLQGFLQLRTLSCLPRLLRLSLLSPLLIGRPPLRRLLLSLSSLSGVQQERFAPRQPGDRQMGIQLN